MEALTTVEYLEAQLGRSLTEAELARAPGAIVSASARIRTYTRQQFDAVADDVVTLPAVGATIVLPQMPAQSVSLVRAISGWPDIAPVTLPCWSFDGVDRILLAAFDTDVWVSLPSWLGEDGSGVATYEVTYSHGYAAVPDIVQDVAAAMVLRTLLSPSVVAGMVNERIGQYSYQLQQGSGAQGIAVRLTDDDMAMLAPWRRRATTVETRAT